MENQSQYSSQWEIPGVIGALHKHYADGLSHSEIARVLYLEFQVSFSRSAIIGKCHRLDLTKRKVEARIKQERRLVITDEHSLPETRKTLLELGNNDCRWPYGDGPFIFCGKLEANFSNAINYCEYHRAVSTRGKSETKFFCEAAA